MLTKKILLVNTNTERSPYPVPPLGLCLLANALKAKYSVRIFDGCFRPPEELPAVARDLRPDFIGISIRNIDNIVAGNSTYYVDRIRDDFVKPLQASTDAIFIAGGSGFSVFPGELLELLGIDYGIVGEGEAAFTALLSALENGSDVSRIGGVAMRASAGAHTCSAAACALDDYQNANIDEWIDYSPYIQRGAYPLQTKRGCAQHCIYCTYPLIEGSSYRVRDPVSIVNEMAFAQERLGQVMFEFVDSTFNDPPGHAEAICREIIQRKIKVRLRTMGINPAHAGRKLFSLMLSAGFSQIDCTPDTASESMLRNLGKNFTLRDLEVTARNIREYNIPTMWFFIFGGPGENESTIRETFEFIDAWVSPNDMVYMMAGLRIYPGTRLHGIACEQGIVDKKASLLRPAFYHSPDISKSRIDEFVKHASQTRPNCIPAAESTPPPDMMARAISLRKAENLKEPMFRTLMRIRREQSGIHELKRLDCEPLYEL